MTNPVFLNDLRKNWFRRRPVYGVALMAILILVLTLVVAAGVPALFGFSSNSYPLWRFPDLLLPVIAPAFAASAFAKEHEQRTWQDLLLTRLTAGEIVAGKFFACFFPTVATIIVLLPPFALILIISSVQWAQEPGFWMVAVSVRFLVLAVFYLVVGLVCSYHSANARASLVTGYVVLALYGIGSFALWRTYFDSFVRSFADVGASPVFSRNDGNGLLSLSKHEFGLSPADQFFLCQSACLCIVLYGYLLFRIRLRREPAA